ETIQGPRHLSFSLNADGEGVALYQTDGVTLIDSISFGVQSEDVSLGRVTDGASAMSIFSPATPGGANVNTYANFVVSAASYVLAPVAPGAIASAFGVNLTAAGASATTTPLPTTIGGVTVTITDDKNVARLAPLFFTGPGQINFQVPEGTSQGRARLSIRRQDGTTVNGDLLIDSIAPGLFSANANGLGVGVINALRVSAAGAQTYLPTAAYNQAQQQFNAVPVSLGAATDNTFLILYGTGIRGVKNVTDVTVEVGGIPVSVGFAGAQEGFVGLDQINIGPLPRTLAGRGNVQAVIRVNGRRANRVNITIQ
ncbi:MAG: hypothetical protein ACKV2V_12035, partial [Blastocatellia bacterium]